MTITTSREDPNLFSPVRVGDMDLPHRVVMAPMTRSRTPGHVPNDRNVLYYTQRSSAALIVTEGVAPSALGQGYIDIPGLYTLEQVQGWRRVVHAVHARGSRIFAQLMFVGRVSHPSFLEGEQPVAPSEVAASGTVITNDGPQSFVRPRALTDSEIEDRISEFVAAGINAMAAGFDGIEIHAANGYLVEQFLATNTNLRTDSWGGSLERRARFLLEITDALCSEIGSTKVALRISPGSTFNDIHDEEAQLMHGYLARELNRRRLAYLHVISGNVGFDPVELVRANYSGTIVTNGGYTRTRADEEIQTGRADLVSFARAFLANPDLPKRLLSGASLNEPNPATFYGGGDRGYLDYPGLDELVAA